MPTYPRTYQLAQAILYHIYNRGISRHRLFAARTDKEHFKDLLIEYSHRFDFSIYHWVIMDNHYHLELEPDEPEDLPRIMSGIGRSYTHYYHKKYKTSGYLWEGRYKSQPIEKEQYLLLCGQYIERNPLQAHMVQHAWDYEYSSARLYVEGIPDGLTTLDPMYETIARDERRRQNEYRIWLTEHDPQTDELFGLDMHPVLPVGSKRFVCNLVKRNGRLIPRRRGRPLR
jgi:putative transposase